MTVVHKGGEGEYVVMQVQPHPSIVITCLGYSRAHLNGFSSALEESSGASGRSWTVHWCNAVKVRTVVHKRGEEEYVVVNASTTTPLHRHHPSWTCGRLYITCVEQRI